MAEGKAELQQVDAVYSRFVERAKELLHVILGPGDDRHLYHDRGDVTLRQPDSAEHLLLQRTRIVILHAEADLIQPCVPQAHRPLFGEQVS